MKLTIVVPSFNYAQFLDACLTSIQQQNYTNFEVLIADGGSTDKSIEIIQSYCETDSRFKLVSTEDNGQADAIQKAFVHATGEVFGFLNADDTYLAKDTFTEIIRAFEQYNDIGLVSFGGYYIDAQGKWIKPINYRYHPFDGFHLMKYRTAVLQPATFWKREVYNGTTWPAKFNFVFDVVFFYRAFQQYSWLEMTKPIAGYRLHGENKSMFVKSSRIIELAAFEELKFGQKSFRAKYLKGIAKLAAVFEGRGKIGQILNYWLYTVVNGVAFISCYRLPSI
jgi:glycosyltransferase involved in cell wall biosynthesis